MNGTGLPSEQALKKVYCIEDFNPIAIHRNMCSKSNLILFLIVISVFFSLFVQGFELSGVLIYDVYL